MAATMVSVAKLSQLLGIVRISAEESAKAAKAKPVVDSLERAARTADRGKAEIGNALRSSHAVPSAVAVAGSSERVAGAWRLVHDQYVRAGILDGARPGGIHAPRTLLESAPVVLTATENGRVASTLSVMTGTKLPADSVPQFRHILAELRAQGEKVIELGMFARDSNAARSTGLGGASLRSDATSGPNSMRALFAAGVAVAKNEGATTAVITVHPHHARYYRALGFQQVGPEAAHPTVDGARAVLLVADRATFFGAERVQTLNQLSRSVLGSVPSVEQRRAIMREVAAKLD